MADHEKGMQGAGGVDGSARARDGATIAYTVYNSRASGQIALVHSLAMDRWFWTPVVERLLSHASVLVLDCRGHGESDDAQGPYTVEGLADDLADVMMDVHWSRAVVAGASMGGCTALAFAQRYPDRAVALGLIDTTSYYGESAPKTWAERADRARQAGLESMVDAQADRWFGDSFRAEHPEVVERCVRTFLANDVDAFAASCHALGACDLRGGLEKLRLPTAIIVGEEDYATPVPMAETLHAGISGSTLRIIPGARHLTPLEQPDVVSEELKRLLDTNPT